MRLLLQAGRAGPALRSRPRVRGAAAGRGAAAVALPSRGALAWVPSGCGGSTRRRSCRPRLARGRAALRPLAAAAVLLSPRASSLLAEAHDRRSVRVPTLPASRRAALVVDPGRSLPPALRRPGRRPARSPPTARSPASSCSASSTGSSTSSSCPHVPYSGSLKSHLAAALAAVHRPAARLRARLGALLRALRGGGLPPGARGAPAGDAGRRAARRGPLRRLRPRLRHPLQPEQRRQLRRGAGPRAPGRCCLAVRWSSERAGARRDAWLSAPGLLLGLAFWCHILAVIHLAAVGLVPACSGRRAPRCARCLRLALGFALGDAPGLLWNAGQPAGSRSATCFPGGPKVGGDDAGPALGVPDLSVS